MSRLYQPSFTRNGLAWLVVSFYVIGWFAYGLGVFSINAPVTTVEGEAVIADLTKEFLMSIIPFVMLILVFYFRKAPSSDTVDANTPVAQP